MVYYLLPQQASASPFQSQNQQPSSHISSQQPPTSNMASQTGLATPLIPTQQGNVSTGRGWSTSIQGQSVQSMNVQGDLMAQGQSTVSPQMGWSSNIAARPQLQAASPASGWSQNIGMSQPQGPGTGLGMGWAGNSQGTGASQGVAAQQTAASIMMGGGQPCYHKVPLVSCNNSQHLVLTLLQTWTFWVDVVCLAGFFVMYSWQIVGSPSVLSNQRYPHVVR